MYVKVINVPIVHSRPLTRVSGVASFTKVEGHKLGLPTWLKDVHLHHSMTFIKDPVMHLVTNITIIIHNIHLLKVKCIVT